MTDKPKRPRDANQLAKFIVDVATGESPVSDDLQVQATPRSQQEFGREGGKIGGVRRAKALTPERRREIALKAAKSRWKSDE